MLGIVVVTYNSEQWLERCVEPWVKELGTSQVVIVDNASSDATVDRASELGCTILEARDNLGYGRAANLGVRNLIAETSVEWILVLNPDTACTSSQTVPRLVHDLQDLSDSTQLVLPLIDASDQRNVRVNLQRYPGPVTALWMILPVGAPAPPRVLGTDSLRTHYPIGSFLLMRRGAWISTNGFDDGYRLYGEDADLAWRLRSFYDCNDLAVPVRVRISHFGNAPLETLSRAQLDLLFSSIWAFNTRNRGSLAAAATATLFVLGYLARSLRYLLSFDGSTSLSHLRVANSALGSLFGREAILPGEHRVKGQAR